MLLQMSLQLFVVNIVGVANQTLLGPIVGMHVLYVTLKIGQVLFATHETLTCKRLVVVTLPMQNKHSVVFAFSVAEIAHEVGLDKINLQWFFTVWQNDGLVDALIFWFVFRVVFAFGPLWFFLRFFHLFTYDWFNGYFWFQNIGFHLIVRWDVIGINGFWVMDRIITLKVTSQ
jgi:hypothetical protein